MLSSFKLKHDTCMEDCPTLCTSGWSFLYPDRDHLVDDDYIQDLGQYPFVFDGFPADSFLSQ